MKPKCACTWAGSRAKMCAGTLGIGIGAGAGGSGAFALADIS